MSVPARRFRGGTDPSSAPVFMLPRPLMDEREHRQRGNPSISFELPALPDDRLVAVLVEHGQPVWSANELRRSGFLRWCAVRFYFDVEAAAQGVPEARERVSMLRAMWHDMRRAQVIDETPDHTVGMWER